MTVLFLLFILSLLGLIFGSFISALSYRSVRGISMFKGRSFCDTCKKKINWYDNIPILSFYFLKGKSRCCKKLISIRYPIIEFFTMIVFILTGLSFIHCPNGGGAICSWRDLFGIFSLPFLLFMGIFLITLFITDFEKKLILDELVFIPYIVAIVLIVFFNPDYSYGNLFLSFATASFFLIIHLLTKGKGMGLGDVKLVLLPSLILGWPYTIIWLFLSFIIGAFIGVLLIILGKAKFGRQIPFGPFLILSYFLVLFLGDKLLFLFKFAFPTF